MIVQALAFSLQLAAVTQLGVTASAAPDTGAGGPTAVGRVFEAVEPLGRARYLIPGMVTVYVAVAAAGNAELERATLRTGAGYALTDIVGGALKLAIGRHRPDSLNDAWRFSPFRRGSEWHSFPSGHTYHAFALASGIAEETAATWPDVLAYALASLVGAQRVYSRAHWPSDVAAGAVLGVVVSRYGRRHLGPRERDPSSPARSTPLVITVRF
jgi:membrane-associated phospholipid phosphatase